MPIDDEQLLSLAQTGMLHAFLRLTFYLEKITAIDIDELFESHSDTLLDNIRPLSQILSWLFEHISTEILSDALLMKLLHQPQLIDIYMALGLMEREGITFNFKEDKICPAKKTFLNALLDNPNTAQQIADADEDMVQALKVLSEKNSLTPELLLSLVRNNQTEPYFARLITLTLKNVVYPQSLTSHFLACRTMIAALHNTSENIDEISTSILSNPTLLRFYNSARRLRSDNDFTELELNTAFVSPLVKLNLKLINALYQAPNFPQAMLVKIIVSPSELLKNAMCNLVKAGIIGIDVNMSKPLITLLHSLINNQDPTRSPQINSLLQAISQIKDTAQLNVSRLIALSETDNYIRRIELLNMINEKLDLFDSRFDFTDEKMELSEDALDCYFNVHNSKRNLSLFTALDTLQTIAADNNNEDKFDAMLISDVFNRFTMHSEKRLPRNLGATCEMLFLYRENNKRKFAETFGETPEEIFSAASNNSQAKIAKRLKSFEL